MKSPTGILRRTVRPGAGAALVSLVAAFAVKDPAPVAADTAKFYLDCPTTEVMEGDSVDVFLVRVVDHQHNDNFGAYWHTDAGTADSTDYVHQNTTNAILGNDSERLANRAKRTFQTREDTLAEGNETFTVRFTPTNNVVDMNNPDRDNTCGITIIDNDPNITGIELVSLPVTGGTYGVGETIEISATFNTPVEVDGNPGLGLWVGSSWKAARYLRGSGSNRLVFGYTVKSDDRDSDGIKMDGGYQDGNGRWHNFIDHTAVTAVGTAIVAYRGYAGISNQSGHKVDGSLSYPVGNDIEIRSRPAKGKTYKFGETIDFALVFSAPVDVDGTVQLNLRVGTGDNSSREATYTTGSGTDTLSFSYTVQSKDRDTNGISVQESYVEDGTHHGLGGSGTVKVKDTDTVIRAQVPGLSNQSNHKLDGRPYVKRARPTSSPASANTYIRGDTLRFAVTFDQEVEVEGDMNLGLIFSVILQRYAAYKSGSGTDVLVFEYVVQPDDRDARGIQIQDGLKTTSLGYSSGTIKARGTNVKFNPIFDGSSYLGGHKVNGSIRNRAAPTIRTIDVTSHAGDDSTYTIDDIIRVTVTFQKDVMVTGSPQLDLDFDGTDKTAAYHSNEGAAAVFVYVVAEGDTDADGIAIGADKLTLNGGTIKDGLKNDATLTHTAVAADTAHKVDGVRPTFSSAATSTDGTQVIVTFSEETTVPALLNAISNIVNVAVGQFFIAVVGVTVDDDEVIPSAASLAGTNLTLTLGAAVTQSQVVEVAYDNIFARDAVGIFIDPVGNALSTFSSQDVSNNSTVADNTATGSAPPDLTLSQTELDITEGATADYTVVLGSLPTADVTVTITSSSTKLSANSTTLTFTTGNWDTAQTVRLTANQDDDQLNYWVSVAHTASGGGYDSSTANLYVVIDDDDDDE